MNIAIAPAKKYKRVLQGERTIERRERKVFSDSAFGALKDAFGKKSSVSYVSVLRKAWRV